MAVELLAVLALVWLRASDPRPTGVPADVRGELAGAVYNLGSTFVLHTLYTNSQPGAAILAILARRLEANGCVARARWAAREHNQWADNISKGNATVSPPLATELSPHTFFVWPTPGSHL